jgi:hypothetical protein
MTAVVHMPDATRRAARITWYRHRWAVAAILGVFGAAALLLLGEGIAMRAWLDGNGIAQCLPGNGGVRDTICQRNQALVGQYTDGSSGQAAFFAGDTAHLLLAVPLAAAMFAGLPWLTREFETGSFRYTWVQGINPVRWLLGTFGSLAGIAAAAALVCGLLFEWWYRIAQWPVHVTPASGWDWDAFGLSPIALVGWTVFAMALAMLIAAVLRRTVPAMAAFAVSYAGCLFLGQWWLRPRLLDFAPVVARQPKDAAWFPLHWNDLWLNGWLTAPDGHVLTAAQELKLYTTMSQSPRGVSQDQWLAAHHYVSWVAYQPYSRLLLFQLALAIGLLGLSALAVLVTVWLLRRKAERS